jgi:RNA polymerase sigma factor (sigma-70 family)
MSENELFESWYQSAWQPCYRVVYAVTLHHADTEEVLSEAFTRAFANFDSLATHPAKEAWVVTTAINVYRDRNRRLRNFKGFLVSQRSSYEDIPSGLSSELLNAIKQLTNRQREIVALRILLDLSSQQTSEYLEISVPTVSTHLRRGLETLRTNLNLNSSQGVPDESVR